MLSMLLHLEQLRKAYSGLPLPRVRGHRFTLPEGTVVHGKIRVAGGWRSARRGAVMGQEPAVEGGKVGVPEGR